MIVKRTIDVETNDYKVGDIISFTLTDGEEVEAMAVKREQDGVIFCFVNCLADGHPMSQKGTNRGGYWDSNLRDVLNGEILDRFPADLRKKLCVFDSCDFLRIPTEREIFGENVFGEDDDKEQWEPMKLRRNRISFQEKGGVWNWYWLMNCRIGSVTDFCAVYANGNVDYDDASRFNGVRPVLKLKIKA